MRIEGKFWMLMLLIVAMLGQKVQAAGLVSVPSQMYLAIFVECTFMVVKGDAIPSITSLTNGEEGSLNIAPGKYMVVKAFWVQGEVKCICGNRLAFLSSCT